MLKIALKQRLSIYADLRKQRRLATKRSLFYGKNKAAKIGIYILGIILAAYLLIGAISLALAIKKEPNPSAEILSLWPFIFAIDFLVRFIGQQTPAQMIKPYILLPIPRKVCIESFLLSSIFTEGNFIWHLFFVPLAIMSVFPTEGILTTILFLVIYQIIIWISSQLYLLTRTRINDHMLWWCIPIVIFAIIGLPIYYDGTINFDRIFDFYESQADNITKGDLLYVALMPAILVILFFINRKEQEQHVMAELSKKHATTSIKSISKFSFFDRFGKIGEYMKLDIKLMLRNKHPRKMLMFTVSYVVIICGFYTFIMDNGEGMSNTFNSNLWCMISFLMIGTSFAQRIMCYEGNYIDFLMIHKDDIFSLLCAKYYIYILLTIFPLIFSIIAIILGKWNILMVLAYFIYTIGPLYIIVLHAAIFNEQTIPLDAKITTHTNTDFNYVMMLMTILIMVIPGIIISLITLIFTENVAYLVMIALCAPILLTHRWWIRRIYSIMMKKKYHHLESFRSSR